METAADTIQLEIRRTFAAAPVRVFDAWTKAEALGAWFAPTPDMATVVHHIDVRPSGSYRIEMRAPDGKQFFVSGRYLECRAPHRLTFTWQWEHSPEESLVEIDISAEGSGSVLVLRHSRFATTESRAGHSQGWEGCLGRLGAALSTP